MFVGMIAECLFHHLSGIKIRAWSGLEDTVCVSVSLVHLPLQPLFLMILPPLFWNRLLVDHTIMAFNIDAR